MATVKGWGPNPSVVLAATPALVRDPPPQSVTTKGGTSGALNVAPVTLSEAVATGHRLTVLRTLAARLAATLDGTRSARDTPLLAQRLMDALEQIDGLGGCVAPVARGTPLDEFTEHLAQRQSQSRTPGGKAL